MKILLPKYLTHYQQLCPISNEKDANAFSITFDPTQKGWLEFDKEYVVYWGYQAYNPDFANKYGVMETGFFNEAAFIDTVGNYQTSSLNSRQAYDEINNFDLKGRKSAKEIVFNRQEHLQSKYNAAHGEVREVKENIILALQNPKDRSIFSVSNRRSYLKFIGDCCKFYGKNLFVKMHPWNTNEIFDELANICKKTGVNFGKAPISIIEGKEFVISYNSTFAVDCCLRDVPIVQYAMGTFYNCFGIHYSKQTFPNKINPIKDAHRLCDFLIHKYCYDMKMDKGLFAKMVKHFSVSNEMFPMTDEFSYANSILSQGKDSLPSAIDSVREGVVEEHPPGQATLPIRNAL